MIRFFESASPAETAAFAGNLAQKARPGAIYCLSGPLGAGKTAFVQGFAKGLGFAGPVTSPTFALMQIYEGGRLPLYHFDLYRLEDEIAAMGQDALDDLDFEAYLEGGGVCLIEWAEYARPWIPARARWVTIERTDEARRRIHITE